MKKEEKIQNWERSQEYNAKKKFIFDYSLIDNIEVDGINHRDAPDFCDAFIASADYDGREMTEEELEELNEDNDFVYEAVCNWLW
jgi:hypothetical protein